MILTHIIKKIDSDLYKPKYSNDVNQIKFKNKIKLFIIIQLIVLFIILIKTIYVFITHKEKKRKDLIKKLNTTCV